MDQTSETPNTRLLNASSNCWRIETANRFAVLMENQAYFDALSTSIQKAERSILILGWQFDPRTRLDASAAYDNKQAEIGHRLRLLVKQKPELDVRLLIWRSPLVIAASQGYFPHRAQRWFRRRFLEFRLDTTAVIGACHHQKVVVIDDKVAFCGGGDISTDRWDSAHHLDDDERRKMPDGLLSAPRHEVMSVMDGDAARALGDLVRERWRRATWERTVPVHVDSDPWPEGVEPDMRDVPIGIARTEPGVGQRAEIRENEHLHLEAIAKARRLIYMENQYFTAPAIAAALARRLAEPDGPEVVLVTTRSSPSWFDRMTMDTARAEVLYTLEGADRINRFFAFAPLTPAGKRIIVHAKMTIIDDELIRVGSTNLNNRSMGYDTECDIAAEPLDEAGRAAITAYRRRSIAHFMGVTFDAYRQKEEALGSVGEAIQSFGDTRMQLLGYDRPSNIAKAVASWQIGDPVSTADAFQPWKRAAHAIFLPPVRQEPGEDIGP